MTSAVNQPTPGGGGGGGARGSHRRAATSDGERPVITTAEAALLDEIPAKFADKPWIVDDGNSSEMPSTRQLVRPSSAAANLQTHPSYTGGLFDSDFAARPISDVGSAGGRLLRRPKTGGPRNWSHGRTAGKRVPASGRKRDRRVTLTGAEPMSESSLVTRQTLAQQKLSADLKVKFEESISIDILQELKDAFVLADIDGNGTLDFDEFKQVFKMQLNISDAKERQIETLFQKIDCTSQGGITWDEFCTYMQLEYGEMQDSYVRARQVGFQLPARSSPTPHRDPVLRVLDTPVDGSFICCSQDGLVTFWSPSMQLRRCKSIVTKEEFTATKPAETSSQRLKPKWITDFLLMSQYNKIIIGTGDREIQFYELSSFEPYCQISGLESVPLKMDYCYTGNDESIILCGDSQGCVNVLMIKSAGECLSEWRQQRIWKKSPKAEGIASIGLDQAISGSKAKFIRWKVHGDWVQQVETETDVATHWKF